MFHHARLLLWLFPRCHCGHTEVGVFIYLFIFFVLPSTAQEPRKGKREESFIHRFGLLLLRWLMTRDVTLYALECLK